MFENGDIDHCGWLKMAKSPVLRGNPRTKYGFKFCIEVVNCFGKLSHNSVIRVFPLKVPSHELTEDCNGDKSTLAQVMA